MRVKIVSDQLLCLSAMVACVTQGLNPDFLGTSATIGELIESNDNDSIDLLLLDLPSSVDARAWLALATTIQARNRILVVPEKNIDHARLAYEFGFRGLIPKTSSPGLVLAVLKLILEGGEYFPCFGEFGTVNHASSALRSVLTERQIAVLRELSHGHTNKEISLKLGISVATVKLDVQAILSVTGAKNRTEATRTLSSLEGAQPGVAPRSRLGNG